MVVILPCAQYAQKGYAIGRVNYRDPLCSPRFDLATPIDSSFSCTYSNALETYVHGVRSYYIALVAL